MQKRLWSLGAAAAALAISAAAAQAASNPELAEKIIGKLQVGMMPPPGRARPKGDTLQVLQATLERLVDTRAALKPEPSEF